MSINFTPVNAKYGLVTQGDTNGCLPAAITNLFRKLGFDVLVIFDSENDEFEVKERTFNLHALTPQVEILKRTDESTGEVIDCELEAPFGETGLDMQYLIVFFNQTIIKDNFKISSFQWFYCKTFDEFMESHQNVHDNYIGSIVLYEKRCPGNRLVDHYISIVPEGDHWYRLDSNSKTVKFKISNFTKILTTAKSTNAPYLYFQFYR